MINIQDIIPFMRDGYVAMDKNGDWNWWECEPNIKYGLYWINGEGRGACISESFDIAPADDWTKSLIKVGGK